MTCLIQERFGNHFQTLLSILNSAEFKEEVDGMGGYDTARMGEIIAEL